MQTLNAIKQIKVILDKINLPSREIKCYGSQITIECSSDDTCRKWAEIIAPFAKVRNIIESTVYTKNNKKLLANPTTLKVFRLYAAI